MDSAILCDVINLIKGPPIKNTIVNEEIIDSPVLKVKYRKTLRAENWSIKEFKKLYNTYKTFFNIF